MGTKFAVVGSNLVLVYKKNILCTFTTSIPTFAGFLLQNYFRFSEDVFHKWHENFEILTNTLHEDLKLIFENRSRTLNFLDIQLKSVNKAYKQTNSFNYLTCNRCHFSHT